MLKKIDLVVLWTLSVKEKQWFFAVKLKRTSFKSKSDIRKWFEWTRIVKYVRVMNNDELKLFLSQPRVNLNGKDPV